MDVGAAEGRVVLDEVVRDEVAEVEGLRVAGGGGRQRLVALQPEEELGVLAQVEAGVHALDERVDGDVAPCAGEVAVVCEGVEQRAGGADYVVGVLVGGW